MVHERGVEIDPKKIEKIRDFKAPTCKKEVQKLLGKVNYLRRFISNLVGKIDAFVPILRLKKEADFTWGAKQQEAFEELKRYLSTPPVVRVPKAGKPFRLYIASEDKVIGAVLTQEEDGKEYIITYLSRRLLDAETRGCEACQRFGNVQLAPAAVLNPIIKPWPFRGWALDFIGQIYPSSSKGHRFVLVATDYFTKWAEAVPLKNMTHTEANGQAESSNKTLLKLVKKKIEEHPKRWHEVLSEALWAHRISKHGATKVTPFELVYGQEAVLPVETLMGDNLDEVIDRRLKALEEIEKEKKRVAKAYNKRVKAKLFQVGNLVWKTILPLGTRSKEFDSRCSSKRQGGMCLHPNLAPRIKMGKIAKIWKSAGSLRVGRSDRHVLGGQTASCRPVRPAEICLAPVQVQILMRCGRASQFDPATDKIYKQQINEPIS
uniref:Retrotransposon protein, putative, unclassified n=2 Tax=Oryza sativa subsp. japonica TaxID=39947 RepID=Q53Q43_ORYSJ|nr:retrotransposon protein, putative, unclassified [Oryza sativa Japonica Group]ABA92250.1 retrotransposon protein, putative, unclassified [Oryza sativa Japonica Group]